VIDRTFFAEPRSARSGRAYEQSDIHCLARRVKALTLNCPFNSVKLSYNLVSRITHNEIRFQRLASIIHARAKTY
jgi:hypothetical protein